MPSTTAGTQTLMGALDGSQHVGWPISVKIKIELRHQSDVADIPSEQLDRATVDNLGQTLSSSIVAAVISAIGAEERHKKKKKLKQQQSASSKRFVKLQRGNISSGTSLIWPDQTDIDEDAECHVKAVQHFSQGDFSKEIEDVSYTCSTGPVTNRGPNAKDCIIRASSSTVCEIHVSKHLRLQMESDKLGRTSTSSERIESGAVELVGVLVTDIEDGSPLIHLARYDKGHVGGMREIKTEGCKCALNMEGAAGMEPKKCL